MKGEQLQLFLAIFGAWSIFVALKAMNCLRTGTTYTFSMLDGGLLRAGKRLTRTGAIAKLIATAGIAVTCMLLFLHAVPLKPWMYVAMGFALVSVVGDFIFDDSN